MNSLAPFQLATGSLALIGLICCFLLTLKSSFRNNIVSILFLGSAILSFIAAVIVTMDAFFLNRTMTFIMIASPINFMGASLSFASVSFRYSMFLTPIPFHWKHPLVRSTPKITAMILCTLTNLGSIARNLHLSLGPFPNPIVNSFCQRAGVIFCGMMGVVDVFYTWSIIHMVHLSKSMVHKETDSKQKIIAFIILCSKIGVISMGVGLNMLSQGGNVHFQVISAHTIGFYVITDGSFIFLFRNIATTADTKKTSSFSLFKKSMNQSSNSQLIKSMGQSNTQLMSC
jgi:hypothetical protein